MNDDDPRLHEAMRDALVRGDKLQAIKLLREARGLGLKEAKDQVERLMGTADDEVADDEADDDEADDDDESDLDEPRYASLTAPRALPAAAVRALQLGHKIQAIKLTREHYGLGLKEAKDLVDAQRVTLVGEPDAPPYKVASGGGWWWVGLFVAAAIAGYFFLFGR